MRLISFWKASASARRIPYEKNKKNPRTGRLVILYAATLIFALIDSPWAYDMFKICLGMTIILPVLLYAYNLMYRVLKHDDESEEKSDD